MGNLCQKTVFSLSLLLFILFPFLLPDCSASERSPASPNHEKTRENRTSEQKTGRLLMKKNNPEMEIWDAGTEFQALPFEKGNPASDYPNFSGDGIRKEVLCRPDGEYGFLHDCAVISFKGTLFAAWYNCPEGEMVGKSVIRGRRSEDGGKTWSEIFTLAGGDGKNASPAGKRGSASCVKLYFACGG